MADKGYLHPFWDGRRFENGVGEDIRTIVELKMNALSYSIRSQPLWCTRLDDPDAITQWRELAQSQEFLPNGDSEYAAHLRTAPALTEYQVSWVLDELHYYARRRDSRHDCQVSCFERIWESDTALPEHLQRDICTEINNCFLSNETTREECRRANLTCLVNGGNTLLDFIHPFDFPLISGRTLRFEEQQEDGYERRAVRTILGTKIGGIPTDFHVARTEHSPQGKYAPRVTRLGYISGVPPTPRFVPLLECITTSLAHFIPLFEHTLTSLHRANHALMAPRIPIHPRPRVSTPGGGGGRRSVSPNSLDQIAPGQLHYERGTDPPDEPGQGIGEGTDDEDDEAQWAAWDVALARWAQTRKVVPPDLPPGGFVDTWSGLGLEEGEEENKVQLKGRNVQVFIKLGRVELTPETPVFKGGEWTCEGSYANRIVACGSVVLDSHNVTEGSLDFRMAVTRPNLTASDPDFACMEYWGKKRGSPLNQHIGSVSMKRGRCIAYPNLYQHRLSSFRLLDPSIPGYRTTLQLQLVDPEIAVLSSTDIPPQPVSWALDALMDSLDERLPNELVLKIMESAVEEEYFIRDEFRWPLRCAMAVENLAERQKLGYYFEELM